MGYNIFDYGIKLVRKIDLRFAHDCNFFICSLPKRFTAGTFEELKIASDAGKPILMYMPDGVASTWVPAQIADSIIDYKDNCHFSDWESLYSYITDVDSGKKNVDTFKWIFISYHSDPLVKSELEGTNESSNN